MTTLKEQLRTDLTDAMRAREEIRTATLRMALTAVTNEEVSGKQARELSDADVLAVLGREAKKRRESATAYDDAQRPELADRERAELAVLDTYLPAPLGDDELEAIVTAAVAQAKAAGAEGPRAMGAVMKLVTPQVTGRADGGRVSAEVRRLLG
jgi:uncharacterized protein YqeY